MDKTRILQQGEQAKFKVDIADFNQTDGYFAITLTYCYRRTQQRLEKADMLQDSAGAWYFTFDTDDIVGRVEVECEWRVEDTDFDEGYRVETDHQYLAFVAATPEPKFIACPQASDERPVTYTRTETSSVADRYRYLQTADNKVIVDLDLDVLLVHAPAPQS